MLTLAAALIVVSAANVARAERDGPRAVRCVAGATAALLHSSELGLQGGVGGWLGGASPVTGELRQPVNNGTITRVCASLSVVVRFGGGAKRTDLFITPKAQYCTHPDFAP